MSLPLPLFIGLRYVRARSSQFFVSFITWVSMLGICVGVAALITILSVMNGFEGELRTRLLSLASHATLSENSGLSKNPGALSNWPELLTRARQVSGVEGVAPYVELQALLTHEPEMSGAIVRGIDPDSEPSVSNIGRSMVAGSLEGLTAGSRHIVLGRSLAYKLAVDVGDRITVMIPVSGAADGENEGGVDPRIQSFTVSGIFEAGVTEHDSVLSLIHLHDALALQGADAGVTGLRLKFTDVFAAPEWVAKVATALGGGFRTSDWTRENANYYRAIRIEKTMMALIMMLIVLVAAFNIVAMLVMVVTDKRTDIAILRTLGLRPRHILGVFVTQGVVIGWLGTILGVVVGLSISLNVESIVPWLEKTFRFQIMDADVYYFTQIPSDTQALDVVLIATAAFVLTVLATLYPARRAARTEPAEALRYE